MVCGMVINLNCVSMINNANFYSFFVFRRNWHSQGGLRGMLKVSGRKVLVILFCLIGCINISSAQTDNFQADSVRIYNYYTLRSFSLAGAIGEFMHLDSVNYSKAKMDVQVFNDVLSRAKNQKRGETQFAAEPQLFVLAYTEGEQHKILINPPMIIDFTENMTYVIKNNQDLTTIRDIIRMHFK